MELGAFPPAADPAQSIEHLIESLGAGLDGIGRELDSMREELGEYLDGVMEQCKKIVGENGGADSL